MYLKSLHIHGFKSFADKTVFEFHQGVTGIVGPNGCGKSNVVDAIRWVLGETSAKALRGGEMADVIFNGTEKRKPLGMAEVTLVMGDCEVALKTEFNEVSITRRVFRDGKSEYRINGTICRLRDIHELFMDTGIGRSAYSIMEQGKIDMLLSSRPEDRRAVFEEAAGITKFKKDKKEALRKLEYTEANLLRTSDVIAEQERRMSSLKRQVAKARRFQTLSQTVTTLDTHLSHHRYVGLNAEREELRTSLRALENRQEEIEREMPKYERAVVAARDAAQELDAELAELREAHNAHKSAESTAQSRLLFNSERVKELAGRIDQNRQDISEVTEKLAQQETDFESSKLELEQLTRRILEQEREVAAREERANAIGQERSELETQMRNARLESNQTQTLVATLTAKIESLLSQIEGNRERSAKLGEERDRLSVDLERAQLSTVKIAEALAEKKSKLGELEEAFSKAEHTFQVHRADLESARKQAAEVSSALTKKQSRLDVLKQLVASGEGFEKGTQAVLKGLDDQATFGAGVKGVLAGLITVKRGYTAALEAALGAHLQAVLVSDSEFAETVIERLSEKQLGQAQLLPADFISATDGGQMMVLPEGAEAWALDKVKGDPAIAGLLESLLGETLIVPDLRTARRLRRELPTVTFVTRDGRLLSAAGVISGGASKGGGGASVLERQNEIASLTEEVEALTCDLDKANSALETLENARSKVAEELEAARDRQQRHKVELSTLEGENSLATREQESLATKLKNVEWELQQLTERATATTDGRGQMEQDLKAGRKRAMELEKDQARIQEDLGQAIARQREADEACNELKTALALEKQARQAAQNQQGPMAARLGELKELSARREAEVQQFSERIESAKEEDLDLQDTIEDSKKEIAVLSKKIDDISSKRAGVADEILAAEKDIAEVRQTLTKATDKRSKEEVAATKVELRLESLVETVLERHQIELEHFQPDSHALLACIAEQKAAFDRTARRQAVEEGSDSPVVDEMIEQTQDVVADVILPGEDGPDWDFVSSALGELKRKLDSMGPVNVDAIQEFEELEERHNFIQKQHDDLSAAKDELLAVIEKINDETTRLFAATFNTVRDNFREMFKELFGEKAQANLILMDEDDPLESGIEVIAKPPGKKLQSISLLSGGERSMTAVALLFSIYMVKPSPFCVLDELDAPLDESNIGRFLKVLDRFIDQSQFIIVTHSKRTMARADVMYGVTMEEFGVSKPVGMRLTNSDTAKEGAKTAAQKAAERLDA